jgi:hypothetical protein
MSTQPSPLTPSLAQDPQHNPRNLRKSNNMLSKKALWLALWILANVIGFSLGELIGGRTGLFGLISNWVGIKAGWWWVAGCVPYGFMFGLCQRLLMQPAFTSQPRITPQQFWAWPIACAVGYAVGIGIGEKFTFGIAPDPALFGPVFGIYVGLLLGIAQAIALRSQCAKVWRWIPACILVWAIGEWAAFVLGFQFRNTPIVGAVIGAVSGLLLLRLCPRLALPA